MHDHSRFQRDIDDVTGVSLSLYYYSQKSLTHNIGSASALPIITCLLISWLDGDSPIHGVSPGLALLSWCKLYIVAVQRTSEQLFLRLQNSHTQMASTILVDRQGVECEKLLALQGQLETAMKTTIRNSFDAIGANLQCCVFFFFLLPSWVLNFFFFWGGGDLQQNRASDSSSCERMRSACLHFV